MDDKKPYLMEDGTLVIPFECSDNAYKYWKQDGKKMKEILTDLNASPEVWAEYTHEKYPDSEES